VERRHNRFLLDVNQCAENRFQTPLDFIGKPRFCRTFTCLKAFFAPRGKSSGIDFAKGVAEQGELTGRTAALFDRGSLNGNGALKRNGAVYGRQRRMPNINLQCREPNSARRGRTLRSKL
jgi:hypothetical protein